MNYLRTLILSFLLTSVVWANAPLPLTTTKPYPSHQTATELTNHADAGLVTQEQEGMRVTFDAASGQARRLLPIEGALTTPDHEGHPIETATTFLRSHTALLGLAPTHLQAMRPDQPRFSSVDQTRHLTFFQQHQGLDVLSALIQVQIAENGSLLSVTNGFYPFSEGKAARQPRLTALAALAAAADDSDLDSTNLTIQQQKSAPARNSLLHAPSWAVGPVNARLAYQPSEENDLRLVWEIRGRSATPSRVHHWIVDAVSGVVLQNKAFPSGGLQENFERGGSGWQADGLWHLAQTGEAACLAYGYHSGNNAFYFGNPDTCTYEVGDRVSGSLTSPLITGIGTHSQLSFKYLLAVEPNAGSFDSADVRVVVAGREYPLRNLQATGPDHWRETPPISLAAFAGQNIQLRFRFDSVDSYNNNFPGWFVDDIVVENDNEKTFGDLVLTLTNDYNAAWNDAGSGARRDSSFWQPNLNNHPGFYALGSLAVGGTHAYPVNEAMILVKPAPGKDGVLAAPVDYEQIWTDRGSRARKDGSCWRPIPPEGYVAMGDVFVGGYNKPSTDLVRCVRRDLAYFGTVGSEIWNDAGSGARADFSTWRVATPPQFLDTETGLFATNTFTGVTTHGKPSGTPVVWVLKLPMPKAAYPEPAPPRLTSTNEPPTATPPQVDHEVYVPFTAVRDPLVDAAWKVANSPFYRIIREKSYDLELFQYNQSSSTQPPVSKTVKTGISKSQTDSFEQRVAITISAEAGVSLIGGSVSTTITTELGWSQSSTRTEFAEVSLEKAVQPPPETAVALWATTFTMRVMRQDLSIVDEMSFSIDSFVTDQFPR